MANWKLNKLKFVTFFSKWSKPKEQQ